MSAVPRLRMFAGPNGSGKSTIKSVLPPELLGVYINPDDIEREIRQAGHLDLRPFSVAETADELDGDSRRCWLIFCAKSCWGSVGPSRSRP